MIPKRRKKQKFQIKEQPQIRCPSHLAWVRGHECAVMGGIGGGCGGKIEAAHVRIGTDGCTGVKPSDTWAIPLCANHHAEQHRIGELSLERKYGIRMKEIAAALAGKSPHRSKFKPE